jgi:Family of unknown function (DUF6350)
MAVTPEHPSDAPDPSSFISDYAADDSGAAEFGVGDVGEGAGDSGVDGDGYDTTDADDSDLVGDDSASRARRTSQIDLTRNRPNVVLPVQRGRQRSATPPPPGQTSRRAPLSVAATVNALWAALWSLVPAMATVAVTLAGPQRPPPVTTVRYGVAAWLLGHGVPLGVAGQPIALVPLGVTILAAWRCVRAGRFTVRALGEQRARSVRPAVVVAVAVAVPYGLLGFGAAALSRTRGLDVSPIRAGLTLGLFALVMAFCGAWARSGFARRIRRRAPEPLLGGVRTGLVAVLLLLTAGAIAVGVQIAVSGATATAILGNMHLNFAGDLGIVLVCLAYAPNLAVWASAYLAGPGFTLGQVPELPVFAGLPERAVTGFGQALLATPVLAGLVAGVLLARRSARGGRPDPGSLAIAAGVAAVAAAAALDIVGRLAAGSLGSGALANTGEVGWEYALIGGLGIGLGVMVGAQITARFRGPDGD